MTWATFSHLDRFLCGVRLRLRVLRVVECTGVGLAIGCGLSLPLMAALALRHASATAPVIICIALGMIGGAGWGLAQVPTLLEAAIEADRQLQWSDLLGTALAFGSAPTDPWHLAVLSDANRRCAEISPSALLLRRLGPRAWSGMALLLTLVLTLCAWIGSPAPSLAHDASALSGPARISPDAGQQPLLTPVAIGRARTSAAPPDGEDAAASDVSANTPQNASDVTASRTPATATDKEANSADGQGGNLAVSHQAPAQATASPDRVTPGRNVSANGRPAGGSAVAADPSLAGDGSSSGLVAPHSTRPSVQIPWTAGDWPRAVDSAGNAIRAGEVPPADRALVRDYFQRD